MTIEEIKKEIELPEYSFLKENEHLGNNIILLTLSGSHAYGTNIDGSDLDIRGVAIRSKKEILLGTNFEQVKSSETDTTIYSLKKMINLLCNCNPSTIELIGLKPEHYLKVTSIGQELLDNKQMFLSRRAINSFGGYENQQLRLLTQKTTNHMDQARLEEHILKTLQSMNLSFEEKYHPRNNGYVKLYTDISEREKMNTEVFMDVHLSHYPLRDYCGMWDELKQTVSSYNKIGKKKTALEDRAIISKASMHLIRSYLMCLDILEKEQVKTYRETEHDLLMDIRNGKYLGENNYPIPEFFEMVDSFEKRFSYAKENTSLPEKPDYDKINDFVMSVNEKIIKGETV